MRLMRTPRRGRKRSPGPIKPVDPAIAIARECPHRQKHESAECGCYGICTQGRGDLPDGKVSWKGCLECVKLEDSPAKQPRDSLVDQDAKQDHRSHEDLTQKQ